MTFITGFITTFIATFIPLILFVIAIILILVFYCIAKEFYTIAQKKGYDNKKYFWWTFFFGVLGCLVVIALPDKNKQATGNILSDELPPL